jgi:hypothetical protein
LDKSQRVLALAHSCQRKGGLFACGAAWIDLVGTATRRLIMTELNVMMDDFLARQAERNAANLSEIEQLKTTLFPRLTALGVASVTVCFEGYGDSGSIEEVTYLDASNAGMPCPEAMIEIEGRDEMALSSAIEELAYSALELHHPGWEINDGAHGELLIDVAKASVQLDCNLHYTAYDSHSTDL